MKKLSFIICVLASLASYADPVTVPNTFSAGTPAKASEVNANFTTLANAVNNSLKPLMVYDSTGKVIGQYFVTVGNLVESVLINSPTDGLLVVGVDSAGFIFNSDGGEIYYQTSDCSGTGFVGSPFTGNPLRITLMKTIRSWPYAQSVAGAFTSGWVIDPADGPLWTSVYINSVFNGGGCETRQVPWLFDYLHKIKVVDLSSFMPPFSVH